MLPLILSLEIFRYNTFNYDYLSLFLKSGTKFFRIQILFTVQPVYHIIFKVPSAGFNQQYNAGEQNGRGTMEGWSTRLD